MTLWTQQRVFTEAVDEALLKRLGRQNPVASGIHGTVRWNDLGQEFSKSSGNAHFRGVRNIGFAEILWAEYAESFVR